ncbi:hypothetical protein NQZ68_024627 [Dissostichus eleginoides]|nr:hypothetical protein NQZ68_024627 [Dissostichus eleginoides]
MSDQLSENFSQVRKCTVISKVTHGGLESISLFTLSWAQSTAEQLSNQQLSWSVKMGVRGQDEQQDLGQKRGEESTKRRVLQTASTPRRLNRCKDKRETKGRSESRCANPRISAMFITLNHLSPTNPNPNQSCLSACSPANREYSTCGGKAILTPSRVEVDA